MRTEIIKGQKVLVTSIEDSKNGGVVLCDQPNRLTLEKIEGLIKKRQSKKPVKRK